MSGAYGLFLLFTGAFLSATILPAQSEALLAALKTGQQYDVVLLVVIATIGNVLGAVVNWILGRYLINFKNRVWFPFKQSLIEKASSIFNRWGVWTLLLAWVPFIGDPLTFVSGVFRTNFWLFLTLVTIGKAGRYILVVSVV